jgi:hypothetical protein
MDRSSSSPEDPSRDETIKRYTRDDVERILSGPAKRKSLFPRLRSASRRLLQPFERLQRSLKECREKIIVAAVMLAAVCLLLSVLAGFVRLRNNRIVAVGSMARIQPSGIRVLLVDVDKPLVKVKVLEGEEEGHFKWVNAHSLE